MHHLISDFYRPKSTHNSPKQLCCSQWNNITYDWRIFWWIKDVHLIAGTGLAENSPIQIEKGIMYNFLSKLNEIWWPVKWGTMTLCFLESLEVLDSSRSICLKDVRRIIMPRTILSGQRWGQSLPNYLFPICALTTWLLLCLGQQDINPELNEPHSVDHSHFHPPLKNFSSAFSKKKS